MADEKYQTTLTGAQVDDALQQLNQRVAEGWAVGSRDGVPQTSGQYYHNNAKYYAENANAAAERAEAAVPAGTAGAVFFDRAQSLIYSQQTQARANIKAGNYNRNLLDNWYFPTAVNQRGFTSTSSSNTNTIDRWKNLAAYTVTYSNGNISIPANGVFGQNIEPALYDYLVGRTVTLSVLYSSGSITSGSLTVPSTGGAYASGTPRMGMNGDSKRFYIYPPESVDVRAVKLELGPYSTLINDTPPDYGEELAKCQRYFQRINAAGSTALPIGLTEYKDASTLRVTLFLPVPLRDVPSMALTGSIRVMRKTGYAGEISAISVQGMADNRVSLNAITSNLAEQSDYNVYLASGAYIDLSADL